MKENIITCTGATPLLTSPLENYASETRTAVERERERERCSKQPYKKEIKKIRLFAFGEQRIFYFISTKPIKTKGCRLCC